MLAELMVANAAFAVIKQTLSNGKEIADAGSALTKYFSASQSIQQKAKMGTGDVLAAYQAKQAIERQEKELEFMLNKQGLLGYYKYQQFRDEFHNNQKQAAKKRKVQQAKLNSNINDGLKAMGIVIIIMAACFGVAYYVGTY
jgi:hypothetical protein|tara:strand:- start:3 stop:428 length:426 start_codon:yes stop_codon:yes gene_type:complete